MIELRDFTAGYGQRILLRDVNALFSKGTLTALVGRNGTGKSTLLRAIAGLNHHYSGEIILDGTDLRSTGAGECARRLAVVTTGRIRVSNLTASEVAAIGRAPYTGWAGSLTDTDRQAVSKALQATGMAHYAGRTLDTMSDGECQRVMIARALAQDTPNLLLDEPTSFLDIPNRHGIAALLQRLAREEDKCIIFSTHELDVALRYADSIALIDGTTLSCLPAGGPTTRECLRTTFGNVI